MGNSKHTWNTANKENSGFLRKKLYMKHGWGYMNFYSLSGLLMAL